MTPALNPSFDPWTCLQTGGQITCTGVDVQVYQDELTDIDCDGQRVYASGSQDARMVRWRPWHKHYTYPVPGDLDARVLTETGAMYRLQSAGEGLLLRDTGTVTFVPGEEYETVAEAHGVHEVYQASVDVDSAICDALS